MKCKPVQLLKEIQVGFKLLGDLQQSLPQLTDGRCVQLFQSMYEFLFRETAHLFGVEAEGEHQDGKLVRSVVEILAQLLHALREN